MAVQRHLAGTLAPFGADMRALDAARVFRLAGTENSRAGAIVRPTFMAAPPSLLWRWDFEALAYEVMPPDRPPLAVERAEIVILPARRPDLRAQGSGPRPTSTLTGATYWARTKDLRRNKCFNRTPGKLLCHGRAWPTGVRFNLRLPSSGIHSD
jgi:hypothetical protein